MKKVIVIGCPGSGKSTFSKALHKISGLSLCHLDLLYWKEDQTRVERSVFLERLKAVLHKDEWIIDGNYASTMEMRISFCDTVIFLDYPTELCLQGAKERRGKARSDMPCILEDDEDFLQTIRRYNSESRPQVMQLLARHPEKEIHILQNRDQADEFLKTLVMR